MGAALHVRSFTCWSSPSIDIAYRSSVWVREFFQKQFALHLPQRPACKVWSVRPAHQLDDLLIILHLLCFSQGNWDSHTLET